MKTVRTVGLGLALLALPLGLQAGLFAQIPAPPAITRTPPPASPAPAAPAPLPQEAQAPFALTHYDLGLNFQFPQHQLQVTAQLTLIPNLPISSATFHLNQNLLVQSVVDGSGMNLGHARQLDQVIVSFNGPQPPQQPIHLTFQYSGTLATAQLSPIAGIRTAYVGEDGAFLLYPGEWFPLAGYNTGRFTADIHATLPEGMSMIASGTMTATPRAGGGSSYEFQQPHASFPGSVIVTALKPQTFANPALNTRFYFNPNVPAKLVADYAAAAAKIYGFLTDTFGSPPFHELTFAELPADAIPSFSSPGLIALSSTSIGAGVNTNLLVDEIAQQWFGVLVSPESTNDAWLQYGAARFSEALYIEHTEGKQALQDLITEFSVGALSYPDTALAHADRLYVFSPEFQDLNYDKGAMLFHMLRWELGDQILNNALRSFVFQYAWKPVSTRDLEQALEKAGQRDLSGFFSQWYQGTSVPTFKDAYTIYRLQSGGYRVTGQVQQDQDLFAMPVQISVDTDGATEFRTVPVSGTSTSFSVDVADRPRAVNIDPNDWILKSSPELKLRVALSRGDNLVAAGNYPAAVKQYQEALQQNPISSLAHYRLAEAYFREQNWQNAANEYRQAMNGDLKPAWINVWSHIQLGKIFDLTGQRDRAVNEYQIALSTHDDTNGAQELARQYLEKPYQAAQNAGGAS